MSRKPPARITPAGLENAALHYLERFASSRANLCRVLVRRADRAIAHWGGDKGEAMAMIEATLAKLTGLGYLDDGAYALNKATTLHRRGKPARAIKAALAAKGVEAEIVDRALETLAETAPEPDLAAALALARRRRMGPFRPPDKRVEFRVRDLAALGRAGFSWEIARAVVEAESVEALTG